MTPDLLAGLSSECEARSLGLELLYGPCCTHLCIGSSVLSCSANEMFVCTGCCLKERKVLLKSVNHTMTATTSVFIKLLLFFLPKHGVASQ